MQPSKAPIKKNPEILKMSAFEMAQKIRNFELSSYEVVKAHVDQCRAVQGQINAFTEECFEKALLEASTKDQNLKSLSKVPLLYGVPFTVKEMIGVKGLMSTQGSIHRKGYRSPKNASLVQRILDEGAILLGITNVPEVGFWFECRNPVFGVTKNPYDNSRTAGGSSGGEGAIIGAGGSPFGIGSDIGGSIRIPAAFCGVYGHKPTYKSVPLTGHFPMYWQDNSKFAGEKYPWTSLGLLTRKASDLAPLFELMIGPDQIDPETNAKFLLKPNLANLKNLKVFILDDPYIKITSATSGELRQATRRAADQLAAQGATLHHVDENIFEEAMQMWMVAIQSKGNNTFNELLNPIGEINVLKEFARMAIGQGQYTIPSLLMAFLEKAVPPNKKASQILRDLALLKTKINELLGDDSVLLMPTHPRVAPHHNHTLYTPFDFSYTGIFNVLGVPATSIPMGFNEEGLPLFTQVIAGENMDHLNFSIAEAIENFL